MLKPLAKLHLVEGNYVQRWPKGDVGVVEVSMESPDAETVRVSFDDNTENVLIESITFISNCAPQPSNFACGAGRGDLCCTFLTYNKDCVLACARFTQRGRMLSRTSELRIPSSTDPDCQF
jgi:hypothetical protein